MSTTRLDKSLRDSYFLALMAEFKENVSNSKINSILKLKLLEALECITQAEENMDVLLHVDLLLITCKTLSKKLSFLIKNAGLEEDNVIKLQEFSNQLVSNTAPENTAEICRQYSSMIINFKPAFPGFVSVIRDVQAASIDLEIVASNMLMLKSDFLNAKNKLHDLQFIIKGSKKLLNSKKLKKLVDNDFIMLASLEARCEKRLRYIHNFENKKLSKTQETDLAACLAKDIKDLRESTLLSIDTITYHFNQLEKLKPQAKEMQQQPVASSIAKNPNSKFSTSKKQSNFDSGHRAKKRKSPAKTK